MDVGAVDAAVVMHAQASIVAGDVHVSARAISLVCDSLGSITRMKGRLLVRIDSPMTLLAIMCLERYSTILVDILVVIEAKCS